MKQIHTLDELAEAAENRRAVVVPTQHPWSKPRPAAVVMQLQAALVHRMLIDGIYLYEKAEKKPFCGRKAK